MSGNRSISPISRRLLEPSFDRTGSVSGLSQSVKLSFVELPGSDSVRSISVLLLFLLIIIILSSIFLLYD